MERMTMRAEAGSWPFWSDEDGEPVDPDALELPAQLLADIEAWTARLDAADGWFEDAEDRDGFDSEGRALWERATEALNGRVQLAWRGTFRDDRAEAPS